MLVNELLVNLCCCCHVSNRKLNLALAFCNNSEAQKKRRQILQKFTFPHSNSDLGNALDQLCQEECNHLVGHVRKALSGIEKTKVDLKPLVVKACANIFSRYFCSTKRFAYDDEDFSIYCNSFDKVGSFHEQNITFP